MCGKCYTLLQTTESGEKEEKRESQVAAVSETFGGALSLVGSMLTDIEHDESDYRITDIQIGSGYFSSKSFIIKIISEIPEKKIKLTHTIFPCYMSF